MDNRERARARDKNQRRPISLEEKQKKFIAAVRKRGNISRQQGENERQRKKSEHVEHIHFLHKPCNWEVSGSFTFYSKQRQRNVQKSVQSCFLLIRKKCAAGATFFFWLIRPPIFFVCFRL